MQLHVIYTEEAMFLSKRAYPSWREIQAEYASYKASLGPWGVHEMIDFLAADYSTLSPSADAQVKALIHATAHMARVTFSDR